MLALTTAELISISNILVSIISDFHNSVTLRSETLSLKPILTSEEMLCVIYILQRKRRDASSTIRSWSTPRIESESSSN